MHAKTGINACRIGLFACRNGNDLMDWEEPNGGVDLVKPLQCRFRSVGSKTQLKMEELCIFNKIDIAKPISANIKKKDVELRRNGMALITIFALGRNVSS